MLRLCIYNMVQFKTLNMKKSTFVLTCLLLIGLLTPLRGQQTQHEKLGRGVVAVKTNEGVFLSWRSLITDDKKLGFDVYRDGTKVNSDLITTSTNYEDKSGTVDSRYVVKAVLNDAVIETSPETTVWAEKFKRIPLKRPAAGKTPPFYATWKDGSNTIVEDFPDGQDYEYSPNDCSVGDLDGDGEYEIIVKWDPSNSRDNSIRGYTGNVYLDAYKMDGTFLWRIDLGKNIRAGAHYTQFLVYDFDGDGKAEVMCRTSVGTIDGQGKAVVMGDDDPNADYRVSGYKVSSSHNVGIILDNNQPEYLTVFNGETGAEITSVEYNPKRGTSSWGDSYGNRSERFLACVAYLDGKRPSAVMCRGYYTRAALAAYDFDGTKLTQKWFHDSRTSGQGAYGEGNHSIAVGDVDGDGCDEIIYGACVINNDGKLLYRTGYGHGDAHHFGDLDPDIEGLEIFSAFEEKKDYGFAIRSAETGKVFYGEKTGTDIGRGMAADIDPNHRGHEFWVSGSYSDKTAINNVYNCKGEVISTKRPSVNFRIYWDGDLQDELFDGRYLDGKITKWNGNGTNTLLTFANHGKFATCNTTKATPNLSADIFGDWREEIILWDQDTGSDLVIFTTTVPTQYKVTTLMHDHIYRMSVAWQNVAYNQPPHLGYYLGDLNATNATFSEQANSGPLHQSIELGESIIPLSYIWKRANDVQVSGLPAGVELVKDLNESSFRLEGTPTAIGTFNYTITTVGADPNATLVGTITVKEAIVLKELAYFSFDETSGTSATNTIYGQADAVGFTPTWVEGIKGNAIMFSDPATPVERRMEQSSYDDILVGNKDFSIELWFSSTEPDNVDKYLLHKGSHAKNEAVGTTGKWIGLQYKNGKMTFGIDDDVIKSNVDISATEFFNGEWHHVVCVRDGATKTIKIYVDGILRGEAADGTGDISEPDKLVIGNCNINFNTPFVGAIDELRIYEGAMSAAKAYNRYQTIVTDITDAASSRSELQVYPTYFKESITVGFPAEQAGRATVSMYSSTGLLVYQGSYSVTGGEKLHLGGLGDLPKDMYILKVEVGANQFVKKLLK